MRVHVGIVALDNWAGGMQYTINLIRSLSFLGKDERPYITLFHHSVGEKFESLFKLVDAHVSYQSAGSNDGKNKTNLTRLLNRVYREASIRLLGEAELQLAIASRRAKVKTLFPVFQPFHRLIPRPIGWIPDFQHRSLPEFFSAKDIRIRDQFFSGLLHQKGDVVFSSEHARADAIRYYGIPKASTHVLRFATVPETSWFADPTTTIATYKLPATYFIVCNQFWVHKDHGTLFEAMQLLAQRGKLIHLVCTGSTEDYRNPEYFSTLKKQIRALGIEEFVHILGMIPRQDQVLLMRGASAVLQPSLFEGWSTVLEDARSLGLRVIASDFPVHVEQNVPGAIYFRQSDSVSCAAAIEEHLQKNPELSTIDQSDHTQRIIDFARTFVQIVAP